MVTVNKTYVRVVGGSAMTEREFVIDAIKELLKECDDIQLLYLIQSLLNADD